MVVVNLQRQYLLLIYLILTRFIAKKGFPPKF
jgi:hypothetical protein